MFSDDFDAMEANAFGDDYDAMMTDDVDDFGSSSWSGGSSGFGGSNSLGPAGDEDFSIQERRRKMIVGLAASVGAVTAAVLILYAFSAGMA